MTNLDKSVVGGQKVQKELAAAQIADAPTRNPSEPGTLLLALVSLCAGLSHFLRAVSAQKASLAETQYSIYERIYPAPLSQLRPGAQSGLLASADVHAPLVCVGHGSGKRVLP